VLWHSAGDGHRTLLAVRVELMLNHVRSDESLQVLLFIVVPLLLLLVSAIFLLIRYMPPSTAKFANFSVSFSRIGREDSYIVYRDGNRRMEFYAGAGARKQVLCIAVPKELPDEDIHVIVPKLEMGLKKLGFQRYKILKEGAARVIAASPPEISPNREARRPA
jgi:hypothetical protein